jgi:hypothetical protein
MGAGFLLSGHAHHQADIVWRLGNCNVPTLARGALVVLDGLRLETRDQFLGGVTRRRERYLGDRCRFGQVRRPWFRPGPGSG